VKSFVIALIFLCSFSSRATGLDDSNIKEALETLDQAIDLQKQRTANQRAEYYYESVVDEKAACTHCPEYVLLIKEVNKIVEKIPAPEDVTLANRQLVEVDRLKFMYYEVVASANGTETCSIFDNSDPTRPEGIDRDKLTLLAEQLIDLPNITSIQFYPHPPAKEKRYLYRGEGMQSHILIEVIVKEDRTALIRYHHYFPYQMPDIGGTIVNEERKFNELELGSKVGGLQVDTKTVVNLSDQTAKASVAGEKREWVTIEARHRNENDVSLMTIIPMEIALSEKSGVKVAGNISHEQKESLVDSEHDKINRAELNVSSAKNNNLLSAKFEDKEGHQELVVGSQYEVNVIPSLRIQGGVQQKEIKKESESNTHQDFNIALGDHEGKHEYLRAQVQRVDDFDTVQLSTKHQWNVNSEKGLQIKTEATQTTTETEADKLRKSEVVLSLTGHNHEYVTARVVQGDDLDRLMSLTSRYGLGNYGSVKVSVDRYDSGKESVSFGHQVKSGKNSFQTNVGHDSETGQFINFQAERKISSTASMILTVQTDSNHNTTLMYQYESKF